MKGLIAKLIQWMARPKLLIQLPNGDWINPDFVIEVTTRTDLDAELASTVSGFDTATVVYVNMRHGYTTVIPCKGDYPEPSRMRDHLADLINKGR